MLVLDVLNTLDRNTKVYIYDKLTEVLLCWCDSGVEMDDEYLNYPVAYMYITDNNGVALDIMYNVVDFNDLNAEQKINAIFDYMYKICPYEHFDDIKDINELEACAFEFWRNSEYTLDKYGNWYDEDFNKI